MSEKYFYRGRYREGTWEYFTAHSDQEAKAEYLRIARLTLENVPNIELETYDEDFELWMRIKWCLAEGMR